MSVNLIPLEDYHKQLIQYFLHDGAYNQHELIDLLHALRDRYQLNIKAKDEIRMFNDVILPLINKHINQYGIDIKQMASEEYENEIYYVCTQNFKAQFVKMDSSYTEKEAAIFEKLLELVITNEEKCITSREVFESVLANDLKIAQKEFNETMARFQRDKWIESGPNNTVILHPRAIVEMQSFIVDNYRDDVYRCQICTRLLIRGLNCSNSSCDTHMHRSCAARYFHRLSNSTASNNSTTRKNAYPCPTCKHEWRKEDVDSVLKGMKKNDENDSRLSNGTGNKKQRTSKTNDRTSRSSARRNAADKDDDDDDDE